MEYNCSVKGRTKAKRCGRSHGRVDEVRQAGTELGGRKTCRSEIY